jgi:hypothetical protein
MSSEIKEKRKSKTKTFFGCKYEEKKLRQKEQRGTSIQCHAMGPLTENFV